MVIISPQKQSLSTGIRMKISAMESSGWLAWSIISGIFILDHEECYSANRYLSRTVNPVSGLELCHSDVVFVSEKLWVDQSIQLRLKNLLKKSDQAG